MKTTKQPPATISNSQLRFRDTLHLGTLGLRSRPIRTLLSSLGIAIGVASMVCVIGISSSAQAELNQQLENLGTSLLRATPNTSASGEEKFLPEHSVERAIRIPGVEKATAVSELSPNVYRNALVDPLKTGGIAPYVVDLNLLEVLRGQIAQGSWFNEATHQFPTTVLGQDAAQKLGVTSPGGQILIGNQLFTVIGILDNLSLAPELNAGAFLGAQPAQEFFGYASGITALYERSTNNSVNQVREVLAPSINPQNPQDIKVSRPSDALAAQNAADATFTGLLIGLGAVAVLVGGIGVANTMILSVMERRKEIGLRRALGATKKHIRSQFLVEALLVSLLGGLCGIVIGIAFTGLLSVVNGWLLSIPITVIFLSLGCTLSIGALAGFYPAIRASRIPPTAAINS